MVKIIWLLLIAQLLTEISALACATNVIQKSSAAEWKRYFHSRVKLATKRKPSSLEALPDAYSSPWGGEDATQWRPEAVLANAVSGELNRAWEENDVQEVLVSAPVKMLNSAAAPYGDGQTNSAVTLGWEESRPAFLATLILYQGGSSKLLLKFHGKLKGPEGGAELRFAGGIHSFSTAEKSAGWYEMEWKIKPGVGPNWGDLFRSEVAFVRPKGWDDWFPLDFRNVVKTQEEMLAQIPREKRKLGAGTVIDPENISVQGKRGSGYPFLAMESPNFGKEINADRYFPVPGSGIHNEFPAFAPDSVRTAVGRGNTLVMEKSPAPFKLAYICFEARNEKDEARYHVPSGGGWHEVGDPAETVFNSLERSPVLFGYANGLPAPATPSGKFAYGLSDIAVFRLLQPGQALVTIAGDTTLRERKNGTRAQTLSNEGRNYHWFAFHQSHDVCALEWVHPCVPSQTNSWGMRCP